jgi:hypothetical protein
MDQKSGLIRPLIVLAMLSSYSAPAKADATRDDVCGVVQAAFVAATQSQDIVYPKDIQSSSPRTAFLEPRLKGFAGSYFGEKPLREGESSDVISKGDENATGGFLPQRDWKGSPYLGTNGKRPMAVEFLNPIFSPDAKLAVVGISFFEGRWGYGDFCALRKTDVGWVVERCRQSWIR